MTADNGENIIIEQGVNFKEILKALDFDLSKTKFGLCTHLHKDHSKGTRDLMASGIDVVMSRGEYFAVGEPGKPGGEHIRGYDYRAIFLNNKEFYKNGDWQVMAFDINHDTPQPMGFLIKHPESGLTLFLTDTNYSKFKFSGLNNLIIEANFCEEIMQQRYDEGYLHGFLRDRIYKNHLSLSNCKKILEANDLTEVNNILLIHLSDSNSDSRKFQSEVFDLTFKNVNIAKKGLVLKWNKYPFG